MKFLLKLFMLISRNTLRLMIIQIIGMNLVLAGNTSSQDLNKVKVSITVTNATLTSVFKQLEEKTVFVFAYTDHIASIDKTFSLKYSRTSLRKILVDLANEANVEFKRINNTISVTPHVEVSTVKPPVNNIALTVSGRVVDENSSPLPGVNVLEKGTANGTTTDTNGDFTLQVAGESSVIVFSFIGYHAQEVVVGSQNTININLAPDVTQMQEVVVIGYQTIEKKDLTGSVAIIDPKQSNRLSANSLAESIQGLSPGVTVQTGGAPGQMAKIEIRGAGSFLRTEPLYVIDGMIADANTTINNNDIASIQILKDASAAAIYGSRAANGVIIITTKQGKEGVAKIGFSVKYGVQKIPKRWDVMNSADFAAMQKQQYLNSGKIPPPSVDANFDPGIDTDWQDEVIRTGSIQDYNMTLSGGTASGSYLISGSYFTNKGVLIGNAFKRGSLRVNTRSEKGRVTFGENLVITNTNSEAPGEGNPFYDLPTMLPVIPIKDPSFINEVNPEGWGIGYADAITYAWNSVAVNNLVSQRNNFAKLVGNAYAELEIFDWIKYRFNVGAEVSFDTFKRLRKTGVWQYNAAPYPSSVNEERARFLNLLYEHTLNFDKKISDHNLSGVVGVTNQHVSREFTAAGRTNLAIYGGDYFTNIGSAVGESSAGGGKDEYRTLGYLGRLIYTFQDKYNLTLTGRIDQDSRFGENYRTGRFKSIAGAWTISEEDFFDVPAITNLKLYASYGELGIIPALTSWPYTAFINNAPRAIFGPDQAPYVGAIQAQLTDPNIKWEERKVQNYGIDVGILDGKVSLTIEAYNSLAEDNLIQLPVAGYLGNLGGDPFVNAGSIRNSGVEVSATYRQNKSDFTWDLSANLTTIKNEVEGVGNRGEGINYIQIGNTRSQVGHSLGEWFLIRTDGLFQSEEEVLNYKNADGKIIQPNAKPGDVKYVDRDGNGEINNDDRDFVGSPWPKLQTGLQFNAGYRQFSFNIQFVGVFGNTIYNDTRRILDSYQLTNFREDIDPWSVDNKDGSDPRLGVAEGDQGIIDNNKGNSDRWLDKGSYVRLRNIEVGYNFMPGQISRAGLNSARLFVSAQNLFTITKYKGLDPDILGNTDPNNRIGRIVERGVDFGNWPSSKIFSVGLQLEF